MKIEFCFAIQLNVLWLEPLFTSRSYQEEMEAAPTFSSTINDIVHVHKLLKY